jgi:hypothetical protein
MRVSSIKSDFTITTFHGLLIDFSNSHQCGESRSSRLRQLLRDLKRASCWAQFTEETKGDQKGTKGGTKGPKGTVRIDMDQNVLNRADRSVPFIISDREWGDLGTTTPLPSEESARKGGKRPFMSPPRGARGPRSLLSSPQLTLPNPDEAWIARKNHTFGERDGANYSIHRFLIYVDSDCPVRCPFDAVPFGARSIPEPRPQEAICTTF